jgi:hypothetical protein
MHGGIDKRLSFLELIYNHRAGMPSLCTSRAKACDKDVFCSGVDADEDAEGAPSK